MRLFSYRNKRAVRSTLLTALALVLLIVAIVICRFIYLGRYIVYQNNSAYLDYEQQLTAEDITERQPVDPEKYPFEMLDAVEAETTQKTMGKLDGYYITTTMMAKNLDGVIDAIGTVGKYNCIMIDVKSVFGNFYYSSKLPGAQYADSDIERIDKLIEALASDNNITLIARVPAFCDPNYAIDHEETALISYSGAFWMDEKRCYWLNPYKNDVQGYLSAIGLELESLGFDEVVYGDFYIPNSDNLSWTSDTITKGQALEDAADNISNTLSGTNIWVGFGSSVPNIVKYSDRAYITTDSADTIEGTVADLSESLDDPSIQIVFLTSSHDTRFEQCSVLRPLIDSE